MTGCQDLPLKILLMLLKDLLLKELEQLISIPSFQFHLYLTCYFFFLQKTKHNSSLFHSQGSFHANMNF